MTYIHALQWTHFLKNIFLTRLTLPIKICIPVPPEVSDFYTGKYIQSTELLDNADEYTAGETSGWSSWMC